MTKYFTSISNTSLPNVAIHLDFEFLRKTGSLIRACFVYIGLRHVGYILNNRVSKSGTIPFTEMLQLVKTSRQRPNEFNTLYNGGQQSGVHMLVYSCGQF